MRKRARSFQSLPLLLVVAVCFFATGAAGLIYEVVWNRVLTLRMGNTSYAIATLLAVFMGGLALGAWIGGRFSLNGRRGLWAYAILEIATGAYCIALPTMLDAVDPLLGTIYRHHYHNLITFNLLQFVVVGALLITPTALMGATLPILVRALTTRFEGLSQMIGLLYAINAGGAFLGAVATGFWLLPMLGTSLAYQVAIAINLGVGLLVAILAQWVKLPDGVAAENANDASDSTGVASIGIGRRMLLGGFFMCGFSAMVFQITWTRVVSMTIGSTSYAFALIAGAFILGLSLGSLLLGWIGDRKWGGVGLGVITCLIGLTGMLTILPLGGLPVWVTMTFNSEAGAALPWQLFLWTFLIFLLPTIGMGSLFPIHARLSASGLKQAGRGVGDTYAANAVGTILGAIGAGFVMVPMVGLRASILLAGALYVIVGAVYLLRCPTGWTTRRLGLTAALLFAAIVSGLVLPRWDKSVLTSGPYVNARHFVQQTGTADGIRERMQQEIVFYKETEADVVTVVDRADGRRDLVINGKLDATSFHSNQNWLGHLPAMLHPDAKDALLIGLGSGSTLGSLAAHANIRSIDVLEISPGVVEAATDYFGEYTNNAPRDSRANVMIGDGRLHLRYTDQRYDMIVSQPSNVWVIGASALFTREGFLAMRKQLAPGGVACVWVQTFNMPSENIRRLAATWADVWAHPSIWRSQGALLFIGSSSELRIDLERMQGKFSDPELGPLLSRIGLHSPSQFMQAMVAADEGVRAFSAGAIINTDDNSRIEYDTQPNAVVADQSHIIDKQLRRHAADQRRHLKMR